MSTPNHSINVGDPAMFVVSWTRTTWTTENGIRVGRDTLTKVHASFDGLTTVCKVRIPSRADVIARTPNWHEHTTCYNCLNRLRRP